MSTGARYVVLVADLLTKTIRDEIPFDSFSYTHALNAAGSFSGTISVRHPKATRENLDPSRTALYVLRNDVCMWSGILWTAKANVGSSNQLQVGGEGWFSYFLGAGGNAQHGRFLKANKTFNTTDQLAIVEQLVTWAQSQPGGDLGIVWTPKLCGVGRTVSYTASQRTNIGQAIQDLAAMANGFDFSFDTAWTATTPITVMNLWYPMQGRRTTGLVFELDSNIMQLTWSIDGTLQADSVDVVGSGTNTSTPIGSAIDTAQLDSYPLLEEVEQAKSATGATTTLLNAQAASLLSASKVPVETLPMMMSRVTPYLAPGMWTMGDWCRVAAHDGYLTFDESFRIIGDQVTVDAQGSEQVQPTFAQAGAFT